MAAVCDWRGRDGSIFGLAIDQAGNLVGRAETQNFASQPGYMKKMMDVCQAQINVAYTQNIHCVRTTQTLEGWLSAIELAMGRPLKERERLGWQTRIGRLYGSFDRVGQLVNEGGLVIRFNNWLNPRLQRRWYLRLYGKKCSSTQDLTTSRQDYTDIFVRPSLPGTMSPPAVPSILPFNTVGYQ